jgi:hypothetical protein
MEAGIVLLHEALDLYDRAARYRRLSRWLKSSISARSKSKPWRPALPPSLLRPINRDGR